MKILVIKPSSLGDVIHSLPFLKAVKDTFKDVQVDWVISKNLQEVLEGNPLINRLIVIDKDSWKKIWKALKTVADMKELIKTLRDDEYDMVVDLQGLLRSGIITFFARSPVKAGFDNAREGSRIFYNKKVSIADAVHAVDRYLEAAKAIGAGIGKAEFPISVDNDAKENIRKVLGNITQYAVAVPSARWQTKRWPPEKFGSLISRLSVPCVITGSSADTQIAERVISSSGGNGFSLCGRTGLKELTALIAGARAVVSNDSGPMHIAAALGIPVIALFGPTDPEKTGPYGWHTNENLRVIRAPVSCSPCFRKKCKEDPCMNKIGVEEVYEAVKEYL